MIDFPAQGNPLLYVILIPYNCVISPGHCRCKQITELWYIACWAQLVATGSCCAWKQRPQWRTYWFCCKAHTQSEYSNKRSRKDEIELSYYNTDSPYYVQPFSESIVTTTPKREMQHFDCINVCGSRALCFTLLQ